MSQTIEIKLEYPFKDISGKVFDIVKIRQPKMMDLIESEEHSDKSTRQSVKLTSLLMDCTFEEAAQLHPKDFGRIQEKIGDSFRAVAIHKTPSMGSDRDGSAGVPSSAQ